jgi:CRP-like cAMP-binding protein
MFDLLQAYLTKHISLTDEELAVFCSKFRVKTTKRSEILLEGGSICRNMHFVNKGCLRIYLVDENGRESTRFLIPEGRFGTAFPSFILQLPEILPRWEQIYRMNLERDYIDAILRIESLITMDAKERYALLMANSPGLIQRLPSKIIADYLGISQETLSRLKSKV